MNVNNISALFTPDYSHVTGLVKHLNDDELKGILNSDEKTNEIIKDLKQVKDIEAEREMLLASNRSISEYNLSKKPILENISKEMEESFREALDLKDKLLQERRKLESEIQVQSKDTLLALLQAATREIEDEAEAAVDVFLKKELSIEDFLGKYLELRKLTHLRRIKAEKLARMLQEEGNQIGTSEQPLRYRKPPPPPVPNNMLPYSNSYINTPIQNIPVAPTRPAPQPPISAVPNSPYVARLVSATNQPSPFTYCSPYPVYPMPQPPQYK